MLLKYVILENYPYIFLFMMIVGVYGVEGNETSLFFPINKSK